MCLFLRFKDKWSSFIQKQIKASTFLGYIFFPGLVDHRGESVLKYYFPYLCFLTEEVVLQICQSVYDDRFYLIFFDDITGKSKFR